MRSQQNQVTALPLSLKNIALLPHWPLLQRIDGNPLRLSYLD